MTIIKIRGSGSKGNIRLSKPVNVKDYELGFYGLDYTRDMALFDTFLDTKKTDISLLLEIHCNIIDDSVVPHSVHSTLAHDEESLLCVFPCCRKTFSHLANPIMYSSIIFNTIQNIEITLKTPYGNLFNNFVDFTVYLHLRKKEKKYL